MYPLIIIIFVSIWVFGHVSLELHDVGGPVPAGASHSVHPGRVAPLRLLRQDSLSSALVAAGRTAQRPPQALPQGVQGAQAVLPEHQCSAVLPQPHHRAAVAGGKRQGFQCRGH